MNKFRKTSSAIAKLDYKCMDEAQDKLDSLTKPRKSLGRLEETAKHICGITGKIKPKLTKKVIFTLAADHGVTEEKISAYPKEVTAQMVYNFLRGGAGINVLAGHIGARVVIVDMGIASNISTQNTKYKQNSFQERKIGFGTRNFAHFPAMSVKDAIRSIETGIDVFESELTKGTDIVGTGEMGIGNTTSSSAITACLTKQTVEKVTGRGTGIDKKGLKNKIAVIKKSLELNRPDPNDPIDVLSKIGGYEIGGLTGIILAASSHRIPVVIDGFISAAAALIAYHINPLVKDYMIASHCSVEKGHTVILKHLGLRPLLDLELRLGEGTGAALAMNIIDASVKIMTQMATFKQAGVSEKSK